MLAAMTPAEKEAMAKAEAEAQAKEEERVKAEKAARDFKNKQKAAEAEARRQERLAAAERLKIEERNATLPKVLQTPTQEAAPTTLADVPDDLKSIFEKCVLTSHN